jgi:transcriptional regulator GlxA family with amidase domain
MNIGSRARRAARVVGLVLLFAAAAVAPPLIAGQLGMRATMRSVLEGAAPAPGVPYPAPPAHDPSLRTAVLLLGDSLTEATDFLIPYELLASSGLYNVYAVARERRPLRLFPGHVDVLPHFSYDEYRSRVGVRPDVVVMPYLEGDTDDAIAARRAFLGEVWGGGNLLLTICGGSYSAARTGLLEGRRLTSHTNVLRLGREALPEVDWIDGRRWVDDGDIVSSAGITSGFDATLHVLAREHGRQTALAAAAAAGYRHTGYLDDPSFRLPETRYRRMMLSAMYVRPAPMAVAVYEGASEIALAALTDTYPRSFAATLTPVAPVRTYVSTRHGLHVIPRASLDEMRRVARLFVAGEPGAGELAGLERWAASQRVTPEPWRGGAGFVYDVALLDLARSISPGAAREAARGLEYPIDHLAIAAAGPPLGLMARPAAWALLGLLMAWGARGLWLRRPSGRRRA